MHRILFRIPLPFNLEPLEIASYGFMIAIGVIIAVYIGAVRAKKSGETPSSIIDLALVLVISGLIGARVFHIIGNWGDIEPKTVWNVIKTFFAFRKGGLAFFGSITFALPTGILFLRYKKLNIWKYGDIVAPSLGIGIAFARIGCFLNGCCYGRIAPANFPLAVYFPDHSIPAEAYGGQVLPLYPTQLISSLNGLLLFVILSIVFRYRKFDGQVFWLFGILYSITRFSIEFLRNDSRRLIVETFTIFQLFAFLFLLLSFYMYLRLHKKPTI